MQENQKPEQKISENAKLVNHFMSEKAGMSTVDKKAIQAKVQEMTKDTPKYQHQKQIEIKRNEQIADMKLRVSKISNSDRELIKEGWTAKIQSMQLNRDLTKYWAHLDFDMFYVACQLLDKPQLKDKPVAVGNMGGVLCTANYEARKYGVRSALPTFIAIKLCPQLILIDTNFTKYKKYSDIFRRILSEFDENLQSHGLDEAYIEITSYVKDFSRQQTEDFINKIRKKIFDETGLTVSCGVGANKMLAKLASEQRKPNNQFILDNDPIKIKEFMKNKALRKIPGIGPVHQFYLKGLGIENPQQILGNTDIISICFSELSTTFFIQSALGLGCNQHTFSERKSVGRSETFKATDDSQFLQNKLKQLCHQVSIDLNQLGLLTINAVFSYQSRQFEKKDKTCKLSKYTSSEKDLFAAVIKPFRQLTGKTRLLGVRCTAILKESQWNKKSIQNFMRGKKEKPNIQSQVLSNVDTIEKNNTQKPITQKIVNTNSMINQKKQQQQNIGNFLCPLCNKFIQCKGNYAVFNRHFSRCEQTTQNVNHAQSQRKATASRTKPKTSKSKQVKNIFNKK